MMRAVFVLATSLAVLSSQERTPGGLPQFSSPSSVERNPAAVKRPAVTGDPLLRLYPDLADVPGLRPTGASQFCGGGEGLIALYDGGYMRFVRAGVTRASRRYYKLEEATVEIIVHQLTRAEAARAFLVSLCQDIRAKSEAAGRFCSVAKNGTSYGYVSFGAYLTSVSFDKEDPKKIRLLLDASGRRLAAAGR